uniref:Uncharacterized protein n=1 Tax=Anguilla anguilla TaxID=7936 RepID=A0A0E9UMA3_ANGAN
MTRRPQPCDSKCLKCACCKMQRIGGE